MKDRLKMSKQIILKNLVEMKNKIEELEDGIDKYTSKQISLDLHNIEVLEHKMNEMFKQLKVSKWYKAI